MGVRGQTLFSVELIEKIKGKKINRIIKGKKLFEKIKGYAATLKVTLKILR